MTRSYVAVAPGTQTGALARLGLVVAVGGYLEFRAISFASPWFMTDIGLFVLVIIEIAVAADLCGMGRFGPAPSRRDRRTDHEKIFTRVPARPSARTRNLAILGLPVTATDDEIRARRKALLWRCHPDRNRGSKAAEERFKQVQAAYEALIR